MTKKKAQQQCIETSQVLYLAFELSNNNWKIGFSIGLGQKIRIRNIEAGDLVALKLEIKLAAKRFKLPEKFQIMSVYEAGRDGFWLHRYLASEGVQSFIVDSASIEVNRRKRRKKTDKLDANSLVRMLIRYSYGDRKVWSVLAVPTAEDEDRRQLHRELSSWEKERKRTSNRIRGLLAGQGIRIIGALDLSEEKLNKLVMWDKRPLGRGLKDRIRREWSHLVFIMGQISELNRERQEALKQKNSSSAHPDMDKIQRLHKLRAIGPVGAWTLTREFFGWRQFKNRRQVGSLAGLVSSHYQSGNTDYDQGISKAGVVPVRQIAIELAWGWTRYQPKSKLTLWYNQRFANSGKKTRKIGIVAVARKLLVELWRYLEYGVVPEGAEFKAV